MIHHNSDQLKEGIEHFPNVHIHNRVLMGNPEYFTVVEEINVHMRDKDGNLQSIDQNLAKSQWQNLKQAYEGIGIEVSVLEAQPNLVDMCFTANPSLVLPLPNGRSEAWVSKMAHPSRVAESKLHEDFFQSEGLSIRHLTKNVDRFEGCGDGILHPGKFLIHAGTGPRTSMKGWEEMAHAHSDLGIIHYELQDERFYHLDTALAPLNKDCAMFVPSAFNAQGLQLLEHCFTDLIPIPEDEALNFAGNAHCPDGKHVLIQSGCNHVEKELLNRGFQPVSIETSEFRKSGGSVFCMKMAWSSSLDGSKD